ncbi:MAG: uncharacterized protein QOE33_1797 [Acidobacteriota bacterium]|nr:uncharacterized protein [Acidobacteriota bacterium]
MIALENFERTDRTAARRLPQRASYEREVVYEILDAGFVCHVAFVREGQPFIIPTAYGRAGDMLYLHGSRASRMLKTLSAGVETCVEVTHVDGLVLARSAFHHSLNYRSVIVFGRAEVVEEATEKRKALRAFTEHLIRGRWDEVREPNERELAATLVLRLPLREASAKVRTGPPIDDEEDLSLPIWAGVLPLRTVAGEPLSDPLLGGDVAVSRVVTEYARRVNERPE